MGIRAPFSLRIRVPVTAPHNSGAVFQHLVDQAVALRLGSRHEIVALGIRLDFLQGLAAALGQDAIQGLASLQDFTRMDFNIRGLALRTALASAAAVFLVSMLGFGSLLLDERWNATRQMLVNIDANLQCEL